MSYHVFYNSEDEYLAHSLKGLARKIHKYLLRIKVGNKYRYFYSKAEIDAYLKKLKGKTSSDKEKMSEENTKGVPTDDAAKKAVTAAKDEISKIVKNKNQEVAKKAVTDAKHETQKIATERAYDVARENYGYVTNIRNDIQSKATQYTTSALLKDDDTSKARANVAKKAEKQMTELQKKINEGSISSGMAALSARAIQDEMEFSLDDIDFEVKRNNGANLKEYLK